MLAGHRFPKRRDDWLLGRWTAKEALTRLMPDSDRPKTHWRIATDEHGAPRVLANGQESGIPISLSHSSGRALCVLAKQSIRIGCDLERIEARNPSFEETWFTTDEQSLLDRCPADDRPLLVTLIWCAKESALKTLRTGLKSDTRRVSIRSFSHRASDTWSAIEVEDKTDGREFHGWWRAADGMLMTVLCDRLIEAPQSL